LTKIKVNEWTPSFWFPNKTICYLITKWTEKQIFASHYQGLCSLKLYDVFSICTALPLLDHIFKVSKFNPQNLKFSLSLLNMLLDMDLSRPIQGKFIWRRIKQIQLWKPFFPMLILHVGEDIYLFRFASFLIGKSH